MGSSNFLEHDLLTASDGTLSDVVATILCQHPGCTVAETVVGKQIFRTDVKMTTGCGKITLFQVKKQMMNGQIWLVQTPQTSILGHRPFSVDQFRFVLETCAGLGIVDKGYEACGAVTVGLNDTNVKYCQWVHNNGRKAVLGDIQHSSTVQKLANLKRGILSAGVACQPWSQLGDKKGENDERSNSLPATLRAGHLLQTPAIMLECTTSAREAEWFQKTLRNFTKATGYVLRQTTMPLHKIWPAKRNRWWATLTHEMFNVGEIPDLPDIAFAPSMNHLFQSMATIPRELESELELDRYEMRQFYGTPEGIGKQMVNFTKPLPTATHSWGSQVKGCACGCRSSGFNSERIEKKGLYGQLVPIKGEEDFEGFKAEKMRHLHPSEVALANGADPTEFGNQAGNLRLELSGVGQCASPIQSLWVYANMMKDVQKAMNVTPQIDPLEVLKDYGRKLFEHRDQFFLKGARKNKYLRLFEQVWEHLGEKDFQPLDEDEEITPFTDFPKAEERLSKSESQDDSRSAIQSFGILSSQEAFDHAVLQAFPNTSSPHKRKHSGYGVPGFETTKGVKNIRSVQPDGGATLVPNNGCGGSSPMTRDPKKQEETLKVEKAEEHVHLEVIQVFVCEGEAKPYPVSCKQQDTIEQLTSAIAKLHGSSTGKAVDTFGCIIADQTSLENEQVIRFPEKIADWNELVPGANLPVCRSEILWQQDARVEMEEMAFYLGILEGEFPNRTIPGIAISQEPDDKILFGNHVVKMLTMMQENHVQGCATYVWYQQHWIPVFCKSLGNHVQITTVPSFVQFVQTICQLMGAGEAIQVDSTPMTVIATYDCGFQTIAWLQSKLLQVEEVVPFQAHQAGRWRMVYYRSQEIQQKTGRPMVFGGHELLTQLLIQHGVAESRAGTCANQLIEALGAGTINQIMKSPRPWADLKSRANLVKPAIKIVQADELQEMIRKRANSGKQVGNKANKSKKSVETPLVLKACQLGIPHAVFKQEDGTELSQLHADQVQSKSRGIMLMNIEEALPFLSLTNPVSSEGVGLLILDHADARLPECHEIVRIPTTCTATGEPLLITAALLQLGEKRVVRNLPSQCLAIQEVENVVLKILIYKDQYPSDWNELLMKPVKTLFQQSPFDSFGAQDVLDVWDRQFLSDRLMKTPAKEASIFAVNIRVDKSKEASIVATSGNEGRYVEPRSHDGRMPSQFFQVVWLHKKSFREAVLARQTTNIPTTLVRSGNRYGLRVPHNRAEEVHNMHRPDLLYLPGAELKKFRVAPLPFGSTKQSLTNLFQKVGWKVRPIGPQGQTKDRQGTTWLVHASEDPTHWVYQLAHGDILITPEVAISVDAEAKDSSGTVVASQKTMQSLRNQKAWQSDAAQGKPDPWGQHDPWQPRSSQKEISVGQMASIQANLEASIDRKLQERSSDVNMQDEVENRVQALEQQVHQLTTNVHGYQQQQNQHNQTIYHQLQSVDKKVDQQQTALQGFLDNKLEEQMQRIEQLFSKRGRHE